MEEKKRFVPADLEIVSFSEEDTITTSGGEGEGEECPNFLPIFPTF